MEDQSGVNTGELGHRGHFRWCISRLSRWMPKNGGASRRIRGLSFGRRTKHLRHDNLLERKRKERHRKLENIVRAVVRRIYVMTHRRWRHTYRFDLRTRITIILGLHFQRQWARHSISFTSTLWVFLRTLEVKEIHLQQQHCFESRFLHIEQSWCILIQSKAFCFNMYIFILSQSKAQKLQETKHFQGRLPADLSWLFWG